MSVYKISCGCKEFDFVFGVKLENKVEVICPKCGRQKSIDPSELKEIKEKGSDS